MYPVEKSAIFILAISKRRENKWKNYCITFMYMIGNVLVSKLTDHANSLKTVIYYHSRKSEESFEQKTHKDVISSSHRLQFRDK